MDCGVAPSNTYNLIAFGSESGLTVGSNLNLGTLPFGTAGSLNLTGGGGAGNLTLTVSVAPSPALAYWTGIQGGNYNWGDNNGTTCNWSSDLPARRAPANCPAARPTSCSPPTTRSSASLTDNLETAYTINSLTVLGSGPAAGSPVTIGGSGAGASLTINAAASAVGGEGYSASTGIVLQSGAAGLTISTPGGVILPATQSWTNNSSGTLRVSSNVSGAPSDNSR